MIADNLDDRTGIDKAVAGFGGIIIVYSAAAGVPARKSVTSRRISAFSHRLVELTVIDSVKGAVLIDNTCKSIGEGGVLYPVTYYRTDSYLPDIGLSSSFGGNNTGE